MLFLSTGTYETSPGVNANCAKQCLTCSTSASSCVSCSSNRVNPPDCTCPAGILFVFILYNSFIQTHHKIIFHLQYIL